MPLTIYAWEPDLTDVARKVPAYTAGGFDDDGESAGSQQGEFNDQTEPTATEVEQMIVDAVEEVAGRVGMTIAAKDYALAKQTAAWLVAANIEGDKQASGSDDASAAYRGKILNYRNNLDQLIVLARMPGAMRLK